MPNVFGRLQRGHIFVIHPLIRTSDQALPVNVSFNPFSNRMAGTSIFRGANVPDQPHLWRVDVTRTMSSSAEQRARSYLTIGALDRRSCIFPKGGVTYFILSMMHHDKLPLLPLTHSKIWALGPILSGQAGCNEPTPLLHERTLANAPSAALLQKHVSCAFGTYNAKHREVRCRSRLRSCDTLC